MKGDETAYRVVALAKGLKLLTVFSEEGQALRLNDLAERTGLPLSTTFRLVATLEQEGFIERLAEGLLRPGPAVLTLGFAALRGLDLVQTSTVVLRNLADSTQQTVNLGTLQSDRVIYLARIRNTDLVTASVQVGSSLPAPFTSMGKVLLAYSSKPLEANVTAGSLKGSFGPNAVPSLAALKTQLRAIKEQGWAVQDEEIAAGLRSVSGPIRDESGNVVAATNIAVQAAPWPIDKIVDELLPPLLLACADISKRLGFTSNPTATAQRTA